MNLRPLGKKKVIKKVTKKLSIVPKVHEFEMNKLTNIPDGIYHGGKETDKYYSSTQVKGILKKELGRESTGALAFGVMVILNVNY